jgi:hypothetical protein
MNPVAVEPHCRALKQGPAFPYFGENGDCHTHGRPQITDQLVQFAAKKLAMAARRKLLGFARAWRLRRVPRTE